jgi:hypothetical protein
MRRVLVFCFFAVLFNTNNLLFAQEIVKSNVLYTEIITETMEPYFDALKSGDVSIIKQLISGRMHERNKTLLEQNTEYPEFLRSYYQNVTFAVKNVETYGDDILVTAMLEFPNYEQVDSRYILRKNIEEGNAGGIGRGWVIVDQLSE